ncbi:hypothetical protein Tco_0332962 [Tanacetum coccineum]
MEIKGCVSQFMSSLTQMQGQISLIKRQSFLTQALGHVDMVKAQIYVGFVLDSLSKEAQAVTSKNDSLAILKIEEQGKRA